MHDFQVPLTKSRAFLGDDQGGMVDDGSAMGRVLGHLRAVRDDMSQEGGFGDGVRGLPSASEGGHGGPDGRVDSGVGVVGV